MKTRVISATVLIILVVACFALGPVTRALFLLAAMIMAVWETCRAIGYKKRRVPAVDTVRLLRCNRGGAVV